MVSCLQIVGGEAAIPISPSHVLQAGVEAGEGVGVEVGEGVGTIAVAETATLTSTSTDHSFQEVARLQSVAIAKEAENAQLVSRVDMLLAEIQQLKDRVVISYRHTGTYRRGRWGITGKWDCCGRKGEYAVGCTTISTDL